MRKPDFLRRFTRKKARTTVYADAEQEAYSMAAREMALRIGANDKPVLAGPWVGGAGEELLYWIPFIRWILDWGGIDSSRVWVMSSGTVGLWYEGVGRVMDPGGVLDARLATADRGARFRENNDGGKDGDDIPRTDLEIVEAAMAEKGFDDVELIHPSHMFQIFKPYREARFPVSYIEVLTRHAPIETGNHGDDPVPELPNDFTAVAFHANDSFPLEDRDNGIAGELVSRLSRDANVVLLDLHSTDGDGRAFDVAPSPRVHLPLAGGVPDLATLTAVLKRARLVVCTHGGLSCLGALSGTDTIGLYTDDRYSLQHLALARKVFRGNGYGNLSVMHTDVIHSLLSSPARPDGREARSGKDQ